MRSCLRNSILSFRCIHVERRKIVGSERRQHVARKQGIRATNERAGAVDSKGQSCIRLAASMVSTFPNECVLARCFHARRCIQSQGRLGPCESGGRLLLTLRSPPCYHFKRFSEKGARSARATLLFLRFYRFLSSQKIVNSPRVSPPPE